MIIVITVRERNTRTGRVQEIASHGVNALTGRNVILPCEEPAALGAHFCNERGEWVLKEPARKTDRLMA